MNWPMLTIERAPHLRVAVIGVAAMVVIMAIWIFRLVQMQPPAPARLATVARPDLARIQGRWSLLDQQRTSRAFGLGQLGSQ